MLIMPRSENMQDTESWNLKFLICFLEPNHVPPQTYQKYNWPKYPKNKNPYWYSVSFFHLSSLIEKELVSLSGSRGSQKPLLPQVHISRITTALWRNILVPYVLGIVTPPWGIQWTTRRAVHSLGPLRSLPYGLSIMAEWETNWRE